MNWIHLAQHRAQGRVLVKIVNKLRASKRNRKFLGLID
jgi:hypothetical protein